MFELKQGIWFAVLFCTLISCTNSLENYTFYENTALGHKRHENGTVEWGTFPIGKIFNFCGSPLTDLLMI